MTEKTVEAIHDAYVNALRISDNSVTNIAENFYFYLSTIEGLERREQIQFDNFLLGVERCLKERTLTFEMTNLSTDIFNTCMMIQLWLNTSKGMKLDINYNVRRKSLDSEFEKLFLKSKTNDFCSISDRFGIREIAMNNSISDMYAKSNAVLGILTKLNRTERMEFKNWVDNIPLSCFSKASVDRVMSLHFDIDTDQPKGTRDFSIEKHPKIEVPSKSGSKYPKMVKDYIHTPKGNGYQSLHFTLRISSMSPLLPGTPFEFQFRTKKMHLYGINGLANHEDYKKNKTSDNEGKKKSLNPFILEEEVIAELIEKEFTDFVNPETDIDGLHFAKVLHNRRLDPSTCMKLIKAST